MAEKTAVRGSDTGERIGRAAEELFARHGYAAVSMRQIAAEAGVQAGSIYLYFADKQTLLFDLMDGHMDALLAAWDGVAKHPAATDRLRTFVQFHIDYHLDRPDAVTIAYMELRNLTPENFARIEVKRRAYEAELENILDEGQEAGEFSVSGLRITAMAIIATLTGVNTWYREGGKLRRDQIGRIYWRLVRRMAGPDRRG